MKLSQGKQLKLNGRHFRFAIILARYNDHIGKELLKNTLETLSVLGVKERRIHLYRVPGALEIPITASLLAQKQKYDAIIALGVVIKGETPHFEVVARESYRGLMDVGLCNDTPIVFGVLTATNVKQAKDRATKGKLNKGKEFAETAVEMAMLIRR